MPYDLSACGLVTICSLQAGSAANFVNIANDGGGVYMETGGNIASRTLRLQIGDGTFANYSSLSISGQSQIVTFGTSNVERMRISNSGNVGIGINSPNFKLHVCSNVTGDGLVVENNLRNITCFKSAGEHSFMYIDSAHQCIYQPSIFFLRAGTLYSEIRVQRASSSDPLGNYTESEGVVGSTTNVPFSIQSCGTRRIFLATNGNVGVGTISPGARLDVCGAEGRIQSRVDSSDGSTINVRPNAGKCGWISYTEDAIADRWGIGIKNGDAKLYFSSGNVGVAGGTTRMVLDGSGNVGINCTSPFYKLHVNGTFYAAGSSQDYKERICKYDTDSCMFMKLKPVTYQYKEEFKHLGKELKSQTQIGLIAEEVAEVAPELAILVKENDNDVVRNVDYEKLTIVLLSEVQKLRKELDDLKTK